VTWPLFLFVNGSACFLVAFVIGRSWVVLIPELWLLVALGSYLGWWGHGLGESWQPVTAMLIGVGIGGSVLGLAARWALDAMLNRRRAR
jgi:hypothetical protein